MERKFSDNIKLTLSFSRSLIWYNHQGCGSGMFIPDPPIPYLGSKNSNKREGWTKIVVIPFFGAINLFLFLKCWRKNLGQFSKNYRTFYPNKLSPSSQNMGLGSGNNLSRIQGTKRHRIPIRNTGYNTPTVFPLTHLSTIKQKWVENYRLLERNAKNFQQVPT